MYMYENKKERNSICVCKKRHRHDLTKDKKQQQQQQQQQTNKDKSNIIIVIIAIIAIVTIIIITIVTTHHRHHHCLYITYTYILNTHSILSMDTLIIHIVSIHPLTEREDVHVHCIVALFVIALSLRCCLQKKTKRRHHCVLVYV